MNKILVSFLALFLFGVSQAYAATALFTAPGNYSTGAYIGIDTATTLQADAPSVPDARGVWNVWSNLTDHLAVGNNFNPVTPGSVTFSLPGHTFNLNSLKMFAYLYGNPRSAGKTLSYTILAYYPGNPTPATVQFTIKSLAAPITKTFTNPELKGLEKAVIQFGSTVGLTYFIETGITPY